MDIINYISVTVFGTVLTIWFCNIRVKLLTLAEIMGFSILSGLINFYIFSQLGTKLVYLFYPLTTHLPLIAYCIVRHKKTIWQAVFAVIMAYMLTTPRKWAFEILAHLSGGSVIIIAIVDILVTVVFLIVAYRILGPKISAIFHIEKRETNLLCIPPIVFYICSYMMSVYTDIIYYNERWTIAVLATCLSLFFTVFEVYYYSYVSNKSRTEQDKKLLSLQLKSLQRLSVKITGVTERNCDNELINTVLTLYRSEGKAKELNMIFSLNLKDCPQQCNNRVALLLAELLEEAVQRAKEYISLTVLMKNGQLCIMLETDAYKDIKVSEQEILERYGEISAIYQNEKGLQLAIAL